MNKLFSFLLLIALVLLLPKDFQAGTVDGISPEYKMSSSNTSIAKQSLLESSRVNLLFSKTIDYQLLQKYKAEIIHEYTAIAAVTVELDFQKMEQISKEPSVIGVKSDQLVEKQGQVEGWGYKALNLPNRIPSTSSGNGVRIAIVDTGIDYKHPDLKVDGGKCVLDLVIDSNACSKSYMDDNGHGTHVAGIIAAQNNTIGILGVAPDVNIFGVKALDSAGEGMTSSLIAAIDWSIQNKMDIINLSLTTPDDDPALKAVINKAYDQGILVVAAAGNQKHITGKEQNVLYPAKYPSVIAVSSLGENRKLIPTSSVGKEIELTAPGGAIYSTMPLALDRKDGSPDGYTYMSGTSMAAPSVSGMAALYMEKYPDYSNEEIRKLLNENALDLGIRGRDALYGFGLIQADTYVEVMTKINTKVEANGTIYIDVMNLPEDSTTYNLYRFGKKIITNGTDKSIKDYGGKGKVHYRIVPVSNGKEITRQSKDFTVQLSAPVIKDMKNDYWFSRHIMHLHQEKIMNGYSNGLIKPFQKINRGEAVIMLVDALGLTPDKSYQPFKDIPAGSFAAGKIAAALNHGIITGFPDGTFRSSQYVTRAEMSMMISRAFKLELPERPISFKDVTSKITGYRDIQKLISNKIAEGYPDGTFRPYEKMTRSTYAVFVSKALNEKLK